MTLNLRDAWDGRAAPPVVEAEWSNPCATATLVIPDGGWDIVASPREGTLSLVGVMTEPRQVPGGTGAPLIGMRFRPGALKALLGIAAWEVRDRVLPLRDVSPALAARIEQQGLTPAAMRRAALAAWARVSSSAAPETRLQRALAILAAPTRDDGAGSVARAAAGVGLSRRQLERLFLEQVGTTPKFHHRMLRLHAALRALRHRHALADAAAAGGYADQSHFTREVHALTGLAPRAVQAWLAPADSPLRVAPTG